MNKQYFVRQMRRLEMIAMAPHDGSALMEPFRMIVGKSAFVAMDFYDSFMSRSVGRGRRWWCLAWCFYHLLGDDFIHL